MDSRAHLIELEAVRRLAARDATLFSDPAIAETRLGWVGLPAAAAAQAAGLSEMARAAREAGITDVVLLGMGGSSLAPLVLARSIPQREGSPTLHVLDTTSPARVGATLDALTPATTLVIVSSKSGSSAEPVALAAIFEAWLASALGDEAGAHLIAITDPGSPLTAHAAELSYAHTLLAPADVGGRFSALSPFAMAPAALAGLDTALLAVTAETMEDACARPTDDNPALALGAWLADAMAEGRDKLHVVCSDPVASFGLWVEQLVAESTGKDGRGLLPVLERADGPLDAHGPDAVTFVLRTEDDAALADVLDRLPEGEPVFEVVIDDAYAVAAEFIHWEWAVSLACAAAGIECFGQPDVEVSKARTREILSHGEAAPAKVGVPGGVALSASDGIPVTGLTEAVAGLVALLPDRGYLAVLAYLPEGDPALATLAAACETVSSALKAPVTLELGPRYLHSTGQYHKGGPAEGVFLTVLARDEIDLPVPGSKFTLGELYAAQAAGDVAALGDVGVPVLAVSLSSIDGIDDVARALTAAVGA